MKKSENVHVDPHLEIMISTWGKRCFSKKISLRTRRVELNKI